MSTNFYAKVDEGVDELIIFHIGKRSHAGLLTVQGAIFGTVDEWLRFLRDDLVTPIIEDEHGNTYSVEDFISKWFTVPDTTQEEWLTVNGYQIYPEIPKVIRPQYYWKDKGFLFYNGEFS